MEVERLYAEMSGDASIGEEARALFVKLHSGDSCRVPRQVASLLRLFYTPAFQAFLAVLFAIVYQYDRTLIITLQLFLATISVLFVCVLIQLSCYAYNALLTVGRWVRAVGTVLTRRSLRNVRFAYECLLHPGWLLNRTWPRGYRVLTRSWLARSVWWVILLVCFIFHVLVVCPVGFVLRLVYFICVLPFKTVLVVGRGILKVSSLSFGQMP